MTIKEAIDVHIRLVIDNKSRTWPFECVDYGPLRLLRDAKERKHDPRSTKFIAQGVDVKTVAKTIREYRPAKFQINVVIGPDQNVAKVKEDYKSQGFRLMCTFPCFVRELTSLDKGEQIGDLRIARVQTLDEAAAVAKAAGGKQIEPEHVGVEKAPKQLYAAWIGEEPVAWVQSIQLQPEAVWVSNMFVACDHRRKGIGKALMRLVLEEDRKRGAKHSVLYSSPLGMNLYPSLGYKQIGVMLLFGPGKFVR